ncbi:hypothetical protein B0H19DRAFT_1096584 [Mycena capillaripes]|nr:hypothetical protein B0H19DRAFT_1096584 [Mycena capillaripes]
MCEIFGLIWASSCLENKKDMTQVPPWYLGHICGLWRHCAISYPTLWSSITVPFKRLTLSHPTQDLRDCQMSEIEELLLRSANAPLDVYWPEVNAEFDSRLMDLVISHCSRWRSMYFDSSGFRDQVLHWLLPVAGQLDQLERLEVASSCTAIPDIFSAAPNLREVVLTDEVWPRDLPPSIVIPWGQITHYRGLCLSERHMEFLKSAPNLLECVLNFTSFNARESPPIILPRLRRLWSNHADFLQHLTTSALEELSLMHPPLATLLPFIHRSSCTLTKLALMCCSALPSEIIHVLQALPTLTSLVYDGSRHGDEIILFNAMSISDAPSDICPGLESLAYGYWSWDSEASQDAFFTMVRSRWNRGGSGHLVRLRVFFTGGKSYSGLQTRINALQDKGFDAVFMGQHHRGILPGEGFGLDRIQQERNPY